MLFETKVSERTLCGALMEFLFLYIFFVFMLATYRCMACMIKLIFPNEVRKEETIAHELTEEKQNRLRDKYSK